PAKLPTSGRLKIDTDMTPINPADYETKEPISRRMPSESGMSKYFTNPWGMLMLSGLGTLAAAGQRDARGLPLSPFAAVGQGAMAGIKESMSIEEASKKLDQQARQHLDEYTRLKPHERLSGALKQQEQQQKLRLLNAGLMDDETLGTMADAYMGGNTGVIAG